ncbi:hypothetical protein Glove_103g130 [Diversispora epigaea]|uniref:Protein kinase domain-containing protein n=1 Tax=Diversispora epigaea TaxID=1348612 RepID=A0A397JCQ8_9GLOM|nr:hypothetical protein Glove_103g130 [Diversispora epigaea]
MDTQEIGWNEKLISVWDKTYVSLDFNIHKTITQREEYRKNMIRDDLSLTKNEKKFLLTELQKVYDELKIGNNSVEKQQCKNCRNWHQATQYCEFCIRNYLENNFRNRTSGNDEIDKLIKECQQKTVSPRFVIEWINYDQFENIEHLTEGGCATIYTATWKNSWLQEVTLNFTLDNTFQRLVVCHGLTKDPSTQDYMLVLRCYDNDLRHFIKDNYHTLTLLQKYKIICNITHSLVGIHIVHRDLHSGNILYYAPNSQWCISDLGLSGPVDVPLNGIYGNLPFIAPEVICGEIYTKKSDIYSIGILMWEVITGKTPYDNHKYGSHLASDIASGYRPKVYKDIPSEYIILMKQCWDADPNNRPDANIIFDKMKLLMKPLYEETNKQQERTIKSKNFKSKIKKFFQSSFTKIKIKFFRSSTENKNKDTQSNENKGSEIYVSQTREFDFSTQSIRSIHSSYAYKTKQFDFEITDEIEQLYHKSNSIGSYKSRVNQEYGIAVMLNTTLCNIKSHVQTCSIFEIQETQVWPFEDDNDNVTELDVPERIEDIFN